MRPPSAVGLLALSFILGVSSVTFAGPAPPKKIQAKFHVASVDVPTTSTIQIFYDDVAPGDQAAIGTAVTLSSSWSILVDDKLSAVRVQTVVKSTGLIVLTLTGPLGADTVLNHHISVLFAGDPSTAVQPETVDVKQPKRQEFFVKGWFLPKVNFTTDKKNANFDISGSVQTGVDAKPQYTWSVLAKYPVEYQGSIYVFKAGPKFTGTASQEPNADPDSLSAGAASEFDFSDTKLLGKSLPINFLFNPIDYEFERKPKQEAVLNNGKATLNKYRQKNTNLIVSGQAQFVEAWKYKKMNLPNVNVNLGTELGSAVSRSVLNVAPKSGYSDNPLRAVAGADVYFDLPKVAKYPFLSVDGHYTVRSPFHPEPFKQDGVNNGNEFYSTKARHYVAVNLARTIVKGANLTAQYRFGSLPPTFSFVDHQVTIGFEVVLGK